MTKQITPVHYETPAEDINGILDNYAWQIKRSLDSGVKSILEIGKILMAARDTLNNKQKFAEWVEKRFPFSVSSAYQYVVNYQNFGSVQTSGLIEQSAMTALATNEHARKLAIKLSAKGDPVTHKKALELVADCQPKTPRLPAPKIEEAEFTVVEPTSEVEPDEPGEDASTEAPATEPAQEQSNRPPRNGKEKPVDLGKCPACAGTKWDDRAGTGLACSKCHHPWGEGTGGDVDEDRVSTKRSKTIKTAEALMREFDDLHLLCSKPREHANSIMVCKMLIKEAREWK